MQTQLCNKLLNKKFELSDKFDKGVDLTIDKRYLQSHRIKNIHLQPVFDDNSSEIHPLRSNYLKKSTSSPLRPRLHEEFPSTKESANPQRTKKKPSMQSFMEESDIRSKITKANYNKVEDTERRFSSASIIGQQNLQVTSKYTSKFNLYCRHLSGIEEEKALNSTPIWKQCSNMKKQKKEVLRSSQVHQNKISTLLDRININIGLRRRSSNEGFYTAR